MTKPAPPATSPATVQSRLSAVNSLVRRYLQLQIGIAGTLAAFLVSVVLGLSPAPSTNSPVLEFVRQYPILSVVLGATVLALDAVAVVLTRQPPTQPKHSISGPQTTRLPEEPLDEEVRQSRLRIERIAQVRQWIAEDDEFATALKKAGLLPWRGRQVIIIGAGTLGFIANVVGLAAIFFPRVFPQH